MEFNLDPVFEYNMNEEEIIAYKTGLLWMDCVCRIFPDDKYTTKFSKKGDPRKSSLFKYCYKMQRELKGIVDPKDFKLYITAQLQMLKSIQIGNTHPHIAPSCLVGTKAWTRWRIWKKKLENINKSKNIQEAELDKINIEEIKAEFNKTKKFLIEKLGELTEDNFKNRIKDLERWGSLGMISGFYMTTSPWFNKYCHPNIDLNQYKPTDDIIKIFNSLFSEQII